MDIRSLSREADRTLAKKMRVSEGVSGEGQAAARCANACLVAKSWVFGILATWRRCLITCRYRVVAPWRRFHLDCYIDGGRGSWVYPLRVAGSKDLWPTRRDCSFFITAPTVT